MSAMRKRTGKSAEVIAIRPTAKMYVTIWNLPELTWAQSGVGIDVRPGSIARGDYEDLITGLVAIRLIRPDESEGVRIQRNTDDTDMYDVICADGHGLYRISPSGSAFRRVKM